MIGKRDGAGAVLPPGRDEAHNTPTLATATIVPHSQLRSTHSA